MLSEKELATVTNRLQVPLIVQDILSDCLEFTDDVRLALHEELSDDQPDSALLSIALAAQKIANTAMGNAAIMKLIDMESNRIIAEYASIWLKNMQEKTLDDNMVFETLVHIPEDLESLAELLDVACIAFKLEESEAADLCEILAVQARAQALIAVTYLETLDLNTEDPLEMHQGFDQVLADQETQSNYNDNVIQFPTGNRVN